MMKNRNQLGMAIVPVMIGFAIVGAGTVMILNLKKSTQKDSAVIRNISVTDMERKRIMTALSDNVTCSQVSNFGSQVYGTSISKNTLYTRTGSVLVEKFSVAGKTYGGNFNNGLDVGGGGLRVSTIVLKGAIATPVTPKDYELLITYTNTTGGSGGNLNRTGKTQSSIKIPMYVKIVAGAVTECYARTDTSNDIDLVVTQACSPTTANTNRKSVLNYKDGVATECVNQFNFADTTDPLHIKSLCGTNMIMNGVTLSAGVVDGSAVTSALGNTVNPSPSGATNYCLHLPGTTSNSDCTTVVAGQRQVMHQMTSSTAICKHPGTTGRDAPTCAAGQILWKNGGGTFTCVTVSCLVANEFVQSISSTGPVCYKAPATTCGANQYVAEFKSTGSDICKELPVISGSCAPGSFGTSITGATGTAGGTLNCAAYNKAKACPASTNAAATFAYSFNGTTSANCTQW